MGFFLSRVVALSLVAAVCVALGLLVRGLAGSDALTVAIFGAGCFIFTLIDVRFWNAKDTASDILEAEESAASLEEISDKVRKRKDLMWARWWSSLGTICVLGFCALTLQFSTALDWSYIMALTAVGYCALGSTAVLAWWMGADVADFDSFQADRREKRLKLSEWETEVNRMAAAPKPDFSKDKHLKGYGKTRRVKHV